MRLIPLAIGAITLFYLGLQSLQFQASRTSTLINTTGTVGEAYNVSTGVLGHATTTLGVAVPNFFLLAIVIFAGVLLLLVKQ